MKNSRKQLSSVAAGLVMSLAMSPSISAESFMTVGQLKDMIDQGPAGKVAAVAYVQGTVDGLLGMDSLLKKELGKKPEFCKFFEMGERGSVEHPATKTEFLVIKWEESGQRMNTLAVDMLIMYMTAQYGCPR